MQTEQTESPPPLQGRARGGLKQEVAAALRWTSVAKFGGQIVNWAITLVVIRLLLPADYGLMAMINIVIGFLAMIAEMGFGASIVQSAILEPYRLRQMFGAALLANGAIFAGLAAGAPSIALFYHEPRLVSLIQVAALGFLINAFCVVPDSLLRRSLNFKRVSQIEIGSGVIGNLSTLAMAWEGWGVWALVLSGLVSGTVRLVALHAVSREFVAPTFTFAGTRRMMSFSSSLTVTRMLWYWSSQADILIAGKLLGTAPLGIYSVAVHLGSLPMQRVSSIVNNVAFSAFAKIQNDRVAIAANVRLAIRLIALFAFPTLWGLAVVAPEVVRIALGRNWLASTLPLQIVALTIPLRMIGTIVSTTIMSIGRVHIAMVTTLAAAILTPPMFLIGAHYGVVGLSLAWLGVTPVLFWLNLYRALPHLGLKVSMVFGEMLSSAIGAALMAAAVWVTRIPLVGVGDAVRLPILIAVGALIYVMFSWTFNRRCSLEAIGLLLPDRFVRFKTS